MADARTIKLMIGHSDYTTLHLIKHRGPRFLRSTSGVFEAWSRGTCGIATLPTAYTSLPHLKFQMPVISNRRERKDLGQEDMPRLGKTLGWKATRRDPQYVAEQSLRPGGDARPRPEGPMEMQDLRLRGRA
jgi:hypothetical protein